MNIKHFTLLGICLTTFLWSCGSDPGTLKNVTPANGPDLNLEVFAYVLENNEVVYISRFKDAPHNPTTLTWDELRGKVVVKRANIVVFENDSVQVILKRPK